MSRAARGRSRRLALAIALVSAALGVPGAVPALAAATVEPAPPAADAPAAPVALPSVAPVTWPAPAAGLPATMASLVGAGDSLEIDGEVVDAVLARELYGPRGFTPLWVDGGEDRIRVLVDVFGRAGDHGLDPSRYHVAAIERRLGGGGERSRAELELLTSDAVMRYGAHVASGAYRPTRPGKEIELAPIDQDPTTYVVEAAAVPDARTYLQSLPPTDPGYRSLMEVLAHYREIAAKGGWPRVPEGSKLTPGMNDPEVKPIRARLAATGEVSGPVRSPNLYDPRLVEAVKRFQARHGLAPDGVIGARTRVALGVSADERVRQLEIALERWRWRPRDLGDRFVLINVPDQRLELRDRDGGVELAMPVIVGKPTWATPEFSAAMTDLVFNPPWNVPPKIARDEILPKAQRDRSYFAREGIAIRSGVTVASARPDSVDDAGGGSRVAVHGPIRLRQAPGPKNPLGRIKFNIANGFGVYLHDTPNKNPFRAPDRRLSHGCVRVGDAKRLAAAVMRDMPEWDEDRRSKVLEGWKTRTVRLSEELPVHIVYRTAWIDDEGVVQFREDVYGRDEELLARWGKPRSARRPPPPATPALEVAAPAPVDDAAGDAAGAGAPDTTADAEPPSP